MKNANNNILTSNLVIIGLLLMIAFSCKKDFLDNVNKANLTDAIQWASEGNADIYLNDIYRQLPNKGNEPENLDNFTDDNDNGFYYTSWNWRNGIVTPASGGFDVWFGQCGPVDWANWSST